MTGPMLGVTLFSFTNEWLAGRYDLEGLLRRVAATGVGPGVEVVGFQTFRGYSEVAAADASRFRNLLDELELTPTSLATNADIAIRRDRWQDDDEAVDYLSRQIDVAKSLGFPVARVQIGLSPAVLERLAPLAEAAKVRLGMELHAPEGPNTPKILEVRAAYDRIGSEYLGFIPDFSATMAAIPQGMLDSFVEQGLPDALLPSLVEIWSGPGSPGERFDRFAALAAEQGVAPEIIGPTRLAYTMFGRVQPTDWADIMGQIVHIHGKFYEIDAEGNEPNIRYPELMQILRDHHYTGTISSEWEGHAFASVDDVDAFDVVASHQALQRRLLDGVPA